MITPNSLSTILMAQWREIRKLTYDYLDMLSPAQLALRLPFAESQPIEYQFWCMVGAHESYLRKLEHGAWQGFASSLDQFEQVTPTLIKQQMQQADAKMERLLGQMDLSAPQQNGEAAHAVVFRMIKHEMHHHGQLINLLFCHHLPIPLSWQQVWALSYEEGDSE
ncbi:MAG: hypothetical protein U0350_32660 [Caldilineaceae bacterium]